MFKKIISGFLPAVLFMGAYVSLNASEALFKADFSNIKNTAAQFKEMPGILKSQKAEVSNNILKLNFFNEKISFMQSLSVPVKLPQTYTLELQFKVEDRRPDNHFNIFIGDEHFLVRSYGMTHLSNKKEQSLKTFSGTNSRKWINLIFVRSPESITVYSDFKELGQIKTPESDNTEVKIAVYNENVSIRKYEIYAGNLSNSFSSNLLLNSSFENLTNDYPDYWGQPHWGIASHKWGLQADEFRKLYRVDSQVAYDGRNSFRIDMPSSSPSFVFQLCNCILDNLKPHKTYTFSIYAKADRTGERFRLYKRFEKKGENHISNEFELTTDWKRYSITFEQEKPGWVQFGIMPLSKASFWFDAAQLEEGSQATRYGKNTAESFPRDKNIVRKNILMPTAGKAPEIDGVLDDEAWENAAKYPMANIYDPRKELEEPSKVYISSDRENIYIAVESFDSQMDKLKADVHETNGPVWTDDSVEIFIKPDTPGNSYYRFSTNSLGVMFAGRTYADLNWTPVYKRKVKKYNDKYVFEIAIPFSTLCIPGNAKGFLLNIGRSCKRTSEASAICPTYGTFLNNEYWGSVELQNDQVNTTAEQTPDKIAKTIDIVPEFSYFSTEKQKRFRIDSDLSQGSVFNWEIRAGKQKILADKTTGNRIISITGDLQPGMYEIEVQSGNVKKAVHFSVAEPVPNEKKVNRFRKTIVITPGKEFFIWGLNLEGTFSDEFAGWAADNGFNMIKNYLSRTDNSKQIADLDIAAKHGIMMAYSPSFSMTKTVNDRQGIQIGIDFFKANGTHPALLAGMWFDEAKVRGIKNSELSKAFSHIKTNIGNGSLILYNENATGMIDRTDYTDSDIASLDHYTIPDLNLFSITDYLHILKSLAGHRPLCIFLQSCGNAYNIARHPTPEEYRSQIYQAFALEVFNIIFWGNVPLPANSMPALVKYRKERDAILESKYLDGTPFPVKADNKRISYSARRNGNKIILIAVNNSYTESLVKFSIDQAQIKSICARFEKKDISHANDNWQDIIEPLGRRVYDIVLE